MKTNNVDFGKSFKFKVPPSSTVYTCHKEENGRCKITWIPERIGDDNQTDYRVDAIKGFIQAGDWVVLPSETTDYTRECIDKLNSFTGCMSYNDSYFGEPAGMLKSTIRQLDKTYKEGNSHNTENTTEDSLLEQIKAFTATSNHSVFIHEGYFEVYQAGLTEFPYKCKDDETLRSVMQALSVLDKVTDDE